MKFRTPQEKDLLNRLTRSPDFQHYVQKLGEEYMVAVHNCLMSPPDVAEVNRGSARQLYLQLKDLGVIKNIGENNAGTASSQEGSSGS